MSVYRESAERGGARAARTASWLAIWVGMVPICALGHHSGAMFDEKSVVTLTGAVKQFQWTNPHCWIQVLVPGKTTPEEWSVEMGSPSQLFRGGWNPKTLKTGDKVVIVIHPMRDGTNGGLLVTATYENGSVIGAAKATP